MFNYFGMLESKYNRYINWDKPFVVRFDGVNVTKNLDIDMLDVNIGGFAYALIHTARILSKIYHTFVIVESDEISIIFQDTICLKNKFSSNKVQKISSIFSQEVFKIFNSLYSGNTIFFDAKSFNIPSEKIESYIKYREKSAKCVCHTYLAKRYLKKYMYAKQPLHVIIENLDKYCEIPHNYQYLNQGILYFNGKYTTREECFSKSYILLD